ncbi:MAG: N-acetylornithine carbamoyltransferase [Saprospiraceae bacterium]|nr:N-acetylornithine carbamoyltransferase [Saprospiraceae bacterium]
MKNFESVADASQLGALIKKGIDLKADPLQAEALGKGKTLVLLFFNPSLRTRLSTEKAGINLGMSVINMNAGQGWQLEFEDGKIMNMDKAEHIREAAAVISQYADIIGIRTFPSLTDRERDYADFILHQFMRYASVPIISLESAIRHPLQSLADLITIEEHKTKARPKVVLSWAPHPRALPQAVSNSFLEWVNRTDVELVITHPEGYELAPQFTQGIPITHKQEEAFEGADFIYTKNWSSFNSYGKILSQDPNWMITPEKMALTDNGKFMHCLPVRRNVVVADGVLNSEASLVIHQANNRTFAAQAVLHEILSTL